MSNNTNGLTVDNFDSDISIALGNGNGDTVTDFSSGGNVITLGNGAGDTVFDDSFGGNVITLGNGADDRVNIGSVFFTSNADVITLGNGNGDSVSVGFGGTFSAEGSIITFGNGNDDSFTTGPAFDQFSTGNIITFGNGNHDSVFSGDPAGGDFITLGNGAGDSVFHDSLLGGDTITLGNGANDTVFDQSGGSDTIQVGHGLGDTVNLGLGVATVTFGGLDAQLSLLNDNGNPSFATPTAPTQNFVSTGNLDVIKGMVAGDSIVLAAFGGSSNTDTLGTATNFAGVANEALLATGTYSAATGTFTENATGHDLLLTYDTQTVGFDSVVLVGAAHEIAGSTISAGTITLG